MVGRVPFLNTKIPSHEMVILVQGDVRLRRPYVVAVARRTESNEARYRAAQALADFLRSTPTQRWLADFGRGDLDSEPLFFPVVLLDSVPHR